MVNEELTEASGRDEPGFCGPFMWAEDLAPKRLRRDAPDDCQAPFCGRAMSRVPLLVLVDRFEQG
jgi:hypothetical protein